MDKYLTLSLNVQEWTEENTITIRVVKLTMGIIKPNGKLIIPEQHRGAIQ